MNTRITPRILKQLLLATLCAGLAPREASSVTLRPVDLSAKYDSRRQTFCCNSADYPGGLATYLGVPFNLGPYDGLNTVGVPGSGVQTVRIPIARQRVLRVFSLMNTGWGQGGGPYLRVEFESALGDIAGFDLFGNVNIRDHAQTSYTCCIDASAPPTFTKNAWASGAVRADMQTFTLPPAFAQQELVEMRIIDSGGVGFQRALLFALSTEDNFCYADLTGDGLVEDDDFTRFVAQYNTLDCSDPGMPFNCSADLNFDGVVDDLDFQIFVVAYDALLCDP